MCVLELNRSQNGEHGERAHGGNHSDNLSGWALAPSIKVACKQQVLRLTDTPMAGNKSHIETIETNYYSKHEKFLFWIITPASDGRIFLRHRIRI